MWNGRLRRTGRFIGLARLPTELLNAIINYVYGKGELYQLCRTTKAVRSMAESRLYQLHFRRSDLAKADILVLLHHTRFELIINTISLELDGKDCSRNKVQRRVDQRLRSSCRGDRCSCDEMDEALGNALIDLPSLRVLRLRCTLCSNIPSTRHGYLLALKTRSLKELKFICYCKHEDLTSEEKLVGCLAVPCMASLNTLYLFTQRTKSVKGGNLERFLKNKEIIPNLQHLHHFGYHNEFGIHDVLLCHYPITRLSSEALSDHLTYESLLSTEGRLTRMSIYFVEEHCADFFQALIKNPTPFRNLQHIGTLLLSSQTCQVSDLNTCVPICSHRCSKGGCDELLDTVLQLTALKSLVSIDARFDYRVKFTPDLYFPTFYRCFSRASEAIYTLRRIFLKIGWIVYVWDFSDTWEYMTKIDGLTTFDIVQYSDSPIWELELFTGR
jgi:hypothetical protein